MPGTVFLTGGSGFVGRSVLKQLTSHGLTVRSLQRSEPKSPPPAGVQIVRGDLFDADVLRKGMAGCTAVVHLVGIIMEQPAKDVTFERIHFEGTRSVVEAAKSAGVRRYVQMSALGTRPNAVSDYHKTKWKAEEYVRGSGLDWTIVRPSMIHGPGGEFMQMEAAWVKKQKMPFLFMPYFGKGMTGFGGSGDLQPVYVEDVARAFVEAIEKPGTIGQTYDLAGPDRMDWPTMHKTVARVLTGKSRLTMPVPAWYAKLLASVAPASLLPFNKAQVQMAEEDNVGDTAAVVRDFGWKPQGFEETLRSYRAEL